ncbi:large ribosomal subunit protein mL40 [Microcaecilia unicolor]|uniref:Large ribosomal subunit protein mL40 n=1 Tax=Microcaecilia unicolor TaxID=1415580 RepID=A0A6P7Z9M9_9AMPH|nr:39S ribosomal protein L40, mitochondrial [Microcaecilia unicolor]XP_030073287.1 39S ribosomal protein L40, mitochondrial [Microcaecilia unicolor]XP_030073288.1 39S ribosomal protein L40, mitochondrial [Microcaecilia unicolor]XP_030073289.1 39S ribosomal protein L40, mitochondrial [Microcaecilia unicolor]
MFAGVTTTLHLLLRESSKHSSRWIWNGQSHGSHWQTSLLALRAALPVRAEPKKKKKVDPRRELAARERLKKKLKKLERVPPELIPIEDFITPARYKDETKVRDPLPLSFEEQERRALLMKRWSHYKQQEHLTEMAAIQSLLKAQQEALAELQLESEELYKAAMLRDQGLLPVERPGTSYTPPCSNYEAPEGKYSDITRVYTQ